MMPERSRFVAIVALALIAVGAWRLSAVVFATPMLGFANQFDMRRTSACVGLWPDVAAEERLQAHPDAPLSRYVHGERRPDECYVSSELLFALPIAAVAASSRGVDLRLLGALKALVLAAVALALDRLLRNRPGCRLAHAILFAVVVCDPVNTLWLNTLYTEFAALLGAYVSIALLIVVASRADRERGPSARVVIAFITSLVFLGLSRQQHFLLPAALALPALPILWRTSKASSLAVVAAVVITAVMQFSIVGRHPTIAAANNADTVLGAILPASPDPARTAERLGLPPRCLGSVGATWYQPMGENLEEACPQALTLERAAVMRVLASEPTTLLRTLLRAFPQLQDWRLGYLGAVEGSYFGGMEQVREVGGLATSSMAPHVTALRPTTFLLALTGSGALLVASIVGVLIGAARGFVAPLVLALYALSVTAWYAIATAIVGDGYVEVARHAQLAAASLYAIAVLLVVALAASWATFVTRPNDTRARQATLMSTGFTAIAIVVPIAAHALFSSTIATIPMSIGVVDRPRDNTRPEAPIEFVGWALDPNGVRAVELVTRSGRLYPSRVGLPYAGARRESLSLYYPAYEGAASAGFSAQIPADAVPHEGLDVRTVVVNANGTRTEIDRRRLFIEGR